MKNIQPVNTEELTQLETLSSSSQNFCKTLRVRIIPKPPEDIVKADGIHVCFYIPRIKTFIVINSVQWLWEIKSCT